MKSFTSKIVAIVLLVASSACTINSTGPRGPEGIPGDDGVQIYSSVAPIYAADFEALDEFISINEFEWDILDEATVDEGLVLGYVRFDGETSWNALPFGVPFENDYVNLRFVFDINSFDLVLEGEIANNNNANEDLFDGDDLRVIAIPPTAIVRAKGLNYKNYEEVARVYNLND
tara:strand:- start:3033 stop:3554 length:522 start_codon:yes stop_codon:yes gene_type:complete